MRQDQDTEHEGKNEGGVEPTKPQESHQTGVEAK